MILADTSVWVNNFRRASPRLLQLAQERQLATHPLVIGELAMGGLPDRAGALRSLHKLSRVRVATHREILALVEAEKLWSLGLGYIDASLLAAARLTDDCLIWTTDKTFRDAAIRLGLDFQP